MNPVDPAHELAVFVFRECPDRMCSACLPPSSPSLASSVPTSRGARWTEPTMGLDPVTPEPSVTSRRSPRPAPERAPEVNRAERLTRTELVPVDFRVDSPLVRAGAESHAHPEHETGASLRGGLSSMAEHRIVAPKVTGSSPVGHPNTSPDHALRSPNWGLQCAWKRAVETREGRRTSRRCRPSRLHRSCSRS